MDKTTRIVGGVCAVIFLVLVVQSFLPERIPVPVPQEPAAECIGDPISVDFAFNGWAEPHTCAVQCSDNQPRYILYTDGRATQCETPPGCNDVGEDQGVLCEPPLTSPAA